MMLNIFSKKLSAIFRRSDVDDNFWSDLETTLIEADVGVDTTQKLLKSVKHLKTQSEVREALGIQMQKILSVEKFKYETRPHVILVLGVNGVGKTTTIAKLAHNYIEEGKKVLLVAGDTFRAAAVEQLKIWAERLSCDIVAQGENVDSAAVAFDGVEKALSKMYDVVIIDTAGRLHTKQNLMEELKKVSRVISKASANAPHEKLLVLDATVGSNGLSQAREFHNAVRLTGCIVTKLDGTAKGGVLFAIADELRLPITHIGIGEKLKDLKPFNPHDFVQSIL